MKLEIDLEWTLRAACKSTDPETFFPGKRSIADPKVREAIAICISCPVRQACLQYALTLEAHTYERHGIYGGLTPTQRNRLAGRAGAAA